MKRGFLNTTKAKSKLADVTNSQASNSTTSKDKGKGKAKAETPADTTDFAPSDLPILDLHAPPPSLKSKRPKGHTRFIFRHWPRDPNGKAILPSGIHGKEAGNSHEFWGATLYDFYFVQRIPSCEQYVTISTGSKLAKAMRALGELEHGKNEIAWADREAEPREILGWDPAEAILAYERRVHAGADTTGSTPPEASAAAPEDAVEVATGDNAKGPHCRPSDPGVQHLPSDIPVESPFHPSHYPSPWPFVPFEDPYAPLTPFTLQRAIPTHLLPKKLYVHDPWDLVRTVCNPGTDCKVTPESWASNVRTYTLSLPPDVQEAAAKAAAAAAAKDEPVETVLITPQETAGPTEQPAIRAFLPKRPRKLTEVPEAHLYLSPKGELGTGNHSIVYAAELELPRNLFCESTYCKTCLDEQVKIEVDRLKESGAWEQQLDEGAKNYNSKYDTISPDTPSSSSVRLPPRYVGLVTSTHVYMPTERIEIAHKTSLKETPKADSPETHWSRLSDAVLDHLVEYKGLVIPVHPNIQWQDPSVPETICGHQAKKKKPVPRTVKFRVAAKLSLPGDQHLDQEAANYLKFPAHFFQHWNGYNVFPPLFDPTPVGALVPQFFGYYTPDKSHYDKKYRSPILLIEHCGKQIEISKLCIDDRHECAALLFRFHAAGWLHASFAERNILMQKQQPTCSPLEEEDQCSFPHKYRRYSFRLIDFGRSEEYHHEGCTHRRDEVDYGKKLFEIQFSGLNLGTK